MSATYAARLVAYEPNGDRLGVLPEPLSWSASVPRNDVGAATVVYSRKAARGALLQRALHEGLEVAVEVNGLSGGAAAAYATWDDSRFTWDDADLQWDGLILESSGEASPWLEPDGCRFIAVKRGWAVDDKTDTVTLTMPGYGWMLAKVRSLNAEQLLGEDHTEAGKRPFLAANAGLILATIAAEYETRHSVTLARDFTTAVDSDGNPWASVTTQYYEHGIPLDVVAANLVGIDMADVTHRGRTWRVTNPSAGVDRDVRLHMGGDVSEAPSEETIEELISHMTVHGGGGLSVTESDPSAPTPWGPWEGFYSNESITLTGTAQAYAQAELARSGRVRGQYTRDLLVTSRHRPFLDFGVGDWITAPTSDYTGERARVEAVTFRQEAGQALVAGLTLHDRFLDSEVKRSRRQRGIIGGAATSGGGSTVRPAPEGADKRTPAAPLGLVVGTSAYIDANGNARGLITALWDEVTTATIADGGGALEVDRYELAVGVNDIGAPWPVVRSVTDTSADYGNLDPGTVLRVRVRARGRYATSPGEWSTTALVTVASDATPPPLPSDPVLWTSRGTVSVFWDGLTELGAAMPVDFSKVLVSWEAVRAETPVSGTDALFGSGALVVAGLDGGSLFRARFQSVDRSGNADGWTDWVSVNVSSVLSDPDVVEAFDERDQLIADADLMATDAHGLASQASLDAIAANNAAQGALDAAESAEIKADAAVTGSVIEYALGVSDTTAPATGWSTTAPTRTPGAFIWMRTVITYGDASTSTSGAVLVTGNDGADGADGDPGADGTSVSILGSVASSSNLPGSGNTAGDGYIAEDTGHLWVWSGSAWVDAGEIRGPEGPPGEPGADGEDGLPGDPGPAGVSVTSITPFYRRQASTLGAPAKPTTNPPPAGWVTTEPDYLANNSLYRVERVIYSNASFAYTDVTKVTAWEIAAAALVSANGRNSRITALSAATGSSNPETGLPLVKGDTWWQWDSMAARNVIGAWTWNGSAWQREAITDEVITNLDVNKLIVSGSARMAQLVVEKIVGDAAYFELLTGDKMVVDEAFAQKIVAGLGSFDNVAAGWITTDMLSLGVLRTNLVPDPSMESDYPLTVWAPFTTGQGNLYQWRRAGSSTATATVAKTSGLSRLGRSGSTGLRLQTAAGGSGQQAGAISGVFPVEAGKTYRVLVHAVSAGSPGALVAAAVGGPTPDLNGISDTLPLTSDHSWIVAVPLAADPANVTVDDFASFSYTLTPSVTGYAAIRLTNFQPAAASSLIVDDVSVVEVGVGGATEITAAGLRLFDDTGNEVGAFVTGRPNYFSIGDPEHTFASIGADGGAAFTSLDVAADPIIENMPLLGAHASEFEPPTDSRNVNSWFDRLPWGPIGRWYIDGGSTYSTSQGLREVAFRAYPGRTYRVTFTGVLAAFANADSVGGFYVAMKNPTWNAAGTNEAATPSYASPGTILGYFYGNAPPVANGYAPIGSSSWLLRCNPGGISVGGELNAGTVRMLLAATMGPGSPSPAAGSITPLSGIQFGIDIEDVGPDVPNTHTAPVASGSKPVTGWFTSTWHASDSETYTGANASRGSFDGGDVIHGRAPAYTAGGIQWGHIHFGSGAAAGSETGKTIGTALSGATIHKAELDLYFTHSWYTGGGTVQIRNRTSTSVNHSTGTPVTTTAKTATSTRRGVWVTVDIKDIVTTGTRGVQIGKTASTDPQQYVRIAGHGSPQRARLRITYSR